ncbi:MAG TPA: DEAD/DEAH box helicase family protein [Desulfuromonadales bacterium]|nr:DEAD/DEAH box helicase family protein [Desulfuromonadales bacterium]
MLHSLIKQKKTTWLSTQDCPVRTVVDYIRHKGELRDAQIEAIETWLFLKVSGGNKPLWQLFSEGFFNSDIDLSKLHISQAARDSLQADPALQGLYEFACQKNGGTKSLLPELAKQIIDHPADIDALAIFKQIFYNADYPDYLFSLPMGAGKTFLMAALMYLDLYFAGLEPNNLVFARNFIILVPSGLKSSIIPSLKTIEKFDPSWVIPEPAASTLKKQISFEVLDQSKSAKKSNRARNPNAQKIARHQPFEDLAGLILVVNAEKVILDRLDLGDQLLLIEHSDDEKDRQANELRNLIGKIPNLSIHIDEVHHAATDDIKLRQVVNRWSANGSLNSIIGYSGTPYLSSADTISISADLTLKFAHITNTVYYYPLVQAIQGFLKKPRVEIAAHLEPLAIIEKGVRDFYASYWNTAYGNGACTKLAIYCGSILRLEEEVMPLVGKVIQELGGNPATDILKYHKGNKEYKLPKENELTFNSLDLPHSKVRIILLVQVGKEGWDCRSLTGVILAQKGDSPANMVLQTSCRCLRQVDKDIHESAAIWLNDFNAKTLNAQLKEEQQTSIAELNNLGKAGAAAQVERFSRMSHLQLPTIEFRQLRVEYEEVTVEDDPNTGTKLNATLNDKTLYNPAVITHRGLNPDDPGIRTYIDPSSNELTDFRQWLLLIIKESFNTLSVADVMPFETVLRQLFELVTFARDGVRFYNEFYDQYDLRAAIRLAFHKKRELRTKSEVVSEKASLLIVEKPPSVEKHDKLYPDVTAVSQILSYDFGNDPEAALEGIRATLRSQGLEMMADSMKLAHAVHDRNHTFHYLPYDFRQSGFELHFLQQALTLAELRNKGLELYYNGERHITAFKILCFSKTAKSNWKRIGFYTPDFLLIQRKENVIHKALIIETKGSGFADQINFKLRKHFMETEFLSMNNDSFGYDRFEFLYLAEDDGMSRNLATLNTTITIFFKD